jgi:ABC-type transport system involved in cytochrome c biogenesis permease subunit
MVIERITIFCFAASYGVALALELYQLFRPRRVYRWLAAGFGTAGLLAHGLFLAVQRPPLASPFGSLLVLAGILAVFYLEGSIHHRRQAWGAIVLPVVFGLTILAAVCGPPDSATEGTSSFSLPQGDAVWGLIHGSLLLLAAVGICVAFVASVMYLLQVHRLRSKLPPGKGLKLLSLERLEVMNRRAINWAFPLLTAGVALGVFLMVLHPEQLGSWTDPKIVGTALLWLVFVLLFYLRRGHHLRGRSLALLTILAFTLLLATLVSSHAIVQGGAP